MTAIRSWLSCAALVVMATSACAGCASQDRSGRKAQPVRLERVIDVRSQLGEVVSLAFSPNGKLLAGVGDEQTDVWSFPVMRAVAALRVSDLNTMVRAAFSPDGRALAVASESWAGGIRLWRTRTWKLDGVFASRRPHEGFITASFSPDGKIIAAADGVGSAPYLWNVATRRVVALGGSRGVHVGVLAFSPDGRTLAAADWALGDALAGRRQIRGDAIIRLWNLGRRRVVAVLRASGRFGMFDMQYSPDGKRLAASGNGIYLWNTATGKIYRRIAGPGWALAFSPDGRLLAGVGGRDAAVWDVATGRLVVTVTDPSGSIFYSVAFSPDGRTLAAGDHAGRVYLWKVGGARLAGGCRRARGCALFGNAA